MQQVRLDPAHVVVRQHERLEPRIDGQVLPAQRPVEYDVLEALDGPDAEQLDDPTAVLGPRWQAALEDEAAHGPEVGRRAEEEVGPVGLVDALDEEALVALDAEVEGPGRAVAARGRAVEPVLAGRLLEAVALPRVRAAEGRGEPRERGRDADEDREQRWAHGGERGPAVGDGLTAGGPCTFSSCVGGNWCAGLVVLLVCELCVRYDVLNCNAEGVTSTHGFARA